MTPALVIAAPASGSGKTILTLALLRALTNRGTPVASCKVGPDYIDPAFHAAATGRPCLNLDSWGMRAATLDAMIAVATREASLLVVEGVMGLFDGSGVGAHSSPGQSDGSTADLAARMGWPVILIIDVRAQADSAAAVLAGFARHRSDVEIAGVVFNRTGGDRHEEIVRAAAAAHVPEIPVLGCVPRQEAFNLPERHLGLIQADEQADLEGFLDHAAAALLQYLDIDALTQCARPGTHRAEARRAAVPLPPLGQRIAVAQDEAFAFIYPAVLDGWRSQGTSVHPFSPLADEAPDAAANAVYLPGGYPELHAGRLAANQRFFRGLRTAATRGAAIYGECGGYMILGRSLIDADGASHAMAGMLALETSFDSPRLHLGYRKITLTATSALGKIGDGYRGHEFHYAAVVREGPGKSLFMATDAQDRDLGEFGLIEGAVMGSFIHLIDHTDA